MYKNDYIFCCNHTNNNINNNSNNKTNKKIKNLKFEKKQQQKNKQSTKTNNIMKGSEIPLFWGQKCSLHKTRYDEKIATQHWLYSTRRLISEERTPEFSSCFGQTQLIHSGLHVLQSMSDLRSTLKGTQWGTV